MPLALQTRLGLGAAAFAGSAAYAASFVRAGDPRLVAAMACVGIAAGTSWVAFGLVLLVMTHQRVSVWEWVDTCLLAMGLGIAVKMAAVAANIAAGGAVPLPVHVLILLIADAAMGTLFVVRARRLGVTLGEALAYWIVLNALFGGLVLVLRAMGVMS